VIVKTTPTKVSIDAAMMPRSASAEPALTGRPPPTLSTPGIESALETATPTASPAASNAVGTTQNRSRLHRCWGHDRPTSLIRSQRCHYTANPDTRHTCLSRHHPSRVTSHASADTELVIEACGELSDIRQRYAIDRCDRNRPAETAGPESAS
jgi:hypothetical protein